MKTDDFDDAIRKKIETINPKFEEKDIDKVVSYVNRNRLSTFRLSNANIVFASVCIMAIAGLFMWNFSQREEKKQLVQTIDSLQKNLVQAKSFVPAAKTDTVYVTKYADVPTTGKSKAPAVTKENIKQNKNNVANNDNDNIYTWQIKPENAVSTQKKTSPSKKEVAGSQYIASKESANQKENAVNGSSAENSIHEKQAMNSQHDSIKNESNLNNQPPTVIAGKTANDQGSIKDATHSENSVISNIQPGIPPAGAQINGDLPSGMMSMRRPSHFLKDVHYRAGVGYETANASFGYSVNGEAMLNDKWSISLGVQMSKLKNENYDNDDDFHHKKGTDFYHAYASDVRDTSSFSDIEIHTTLISIPVMLNYYIALRHNFSLLFGAGTDVDVYATQQVGYHHRDSNNPDNPKSFNSKRPTLFFNNVTLTAGIQKEWRRFVFQADPFIRPQITSVSYKNDNLYFGLGVKILYTI